MSECFNRSKEAPGLPAERVLVVDDEDSIREIVCSMLNSAGYDCTPAASGWDALALLESGEDFSLALSDMMMPGIDGLTLLERLKERQPDIPVIMVTAVHDISVALGSIRNGAYDYLLKPFEREQLLATVRRALENRRLRLENREYQMNLEALVEKKTEQLRGTMGDLKRAMGDLERSYDITLQALGDALDLKDAETEGHSKRVTAYTIAIAKRVGVDEDKLKVIARGAFLHDIGKMAIPDAILRKPGPLTDEERAIMREHCYRGYQIVKRIPFLQEAADIVYSHQECYDGSGYPRGLRGDEIPLGSRIFAIADTLDAITSDRPYRKAQSFRAAKNEIMRYAGTQFDPDIVRIFVGMPESFWDGLRRDLDAQSYRAVEARRAAQVAAGAQLAAGI